MPRPFIPSPLLYWMALVTHSYSVTQFRRPGICHFHFPPSSNSHSVTVKPLSDNLLSDVLSHLLHGCCNGLLPSSWLNRAVSVHALTKGIILMHRYDHINLLPQTLPPFPRTPTSKLRKVHQAIISQPSPPLQFQHLLQPTDVL